MVSGHRVSGECWLDLGEITRGKKISTKISIYNSGPRDAFVVATCHPGIHVIRLNCYNKCTTLGCSINRNRRV